MSIKLGKSENGNWITLPLQPYHGIIAGKTGTGKSSFLMSYLAQLANCPNVQIIGYDPEQILSRPWTNTNLSWCDDPWDWASVQQWFYQLDTIMHQRRSLLHVYGVEKLNISHIPLLVIICDEFQQLMHMCSMNKKTGGDQITNIIFDIAARSRKLNCQLLISIQRPDVSALGGTGAGYFRSNLNLRITFGTDAEGLTMLHDGIPTHIAEQHINNTIPGIGLLSGLPGYPGVIRFKAPCISYETYCTKIFQTLKEHTNARNN